MDSGADCSSRAECCQRHRPASEKRVGVRMALAAIAYPLLWSGAFRSLLSSGLLLGVFLLALLLRVFWRFVAHYGAPFAGYSAIARGPLFLGTRIIAQKVKCLLRDPPIAPAQYLVYNRRKARGISGA
jgi:hypothetical protein